MSMITEVNAATGETVTREMTPAERAEYDARQQAAALAAQAQAQHEATVTAIRQTLASLIDARLAPSVGKQAADLTDHEIMLILTRLLFERIPESGTFAADGTLKPLTDW